MFWILWGTATGLKISQRLMTAAIHWAEATSANGLQKGRSLTEAEMKTARDMGVTSPKLVRLTIGPVPLPTDSLEEARARMGIGEATGMCLGYAVFLDREPSDSRDIVLLHELRHVYQFEGTDGLASFIRIYLEQLSEYGYLMPWEVDARDSASLCIRA